MHRFGALIYWMVRPLVKLFFSFQGKPRARVWLTNQHGQVLLTKTWFGRQRWSLPGGGIERRETPLQAAVRELREETGIRLPDSAFAEYGRLRPRGGDFDVVVFTAHVDSDELPPLERGRNLEIIGRQWVDPAALPEDASTLVEDLSKALMLADNG